MYLLIVIIIASAIIGTWIAVEEEEATGVGLLMFVALLLLFGMFTNKEYTTTTQSNEIITLKDNSSVNGNFFLGCGSVDGTMKYVFYYKNSPDTYKLRSINCNNVEISYATGTPKLKTIKTHPDPTIKSNKWKIDVFGESTTYIIEVPPNSIKTGFVLDAE